MSRFTNDPNFLLEMALNRISQIVDREEGTEIQTSTHPLYDKKWKDWYKWRLAYQADDDFKEEYLETFSNREKIEAFTKRKRMTYVTPHAQVAVNECKDAIFQRLVNVNRSGGPDSWRGAISGERGGVDLNGSTINGFIGNDVLPELLPIGKVGIYVDHPAISGATLAEVDNSHPYLYVYRAEDIRNWVWRSTGETKQLTALLLRDIVHKLDPKTNMPAGTTTQFRYFFFVNNTVAVQMFDEEGQPLGGPRLLGLREIPFVMLELIPTGLMSNVADYQIALMNLESSDLQYALSGNVPLYTEQFNPLIESPFLREANDNDGSDPDSGNIDPGETGDANKARKRKVEMGVGVARRYPKDLDRPGFIHPSAEPLKASMAKGDSIKKDIRMNVKLAVQNLNPRRESAESKGMDERNLEAGLSAIGLILETAERQIAKHWATYEGSKESASVFYPRRWDLKTQKERAEESTELRDAIKTTPSETFKKAAMKRIVANSLHDVASVDEIERMQREIDGAEVIVGDAEQIKNDIEAGLLSLDSAAKFRGYPDGEVEKAAKDHADRVRRIAESQASARGAPDLGGLANVSKEEKSGDATGVEE